jgi:SOS-response transcriptional repressor LexA
MDIKNFPVDAVKAAITEKYGSLSSFAEAINITKQALAQKLNAPSEKFILQLNSFGFYLKEIDSEKNAGNSVNTVSHIGHRIKAIRKQIGLTQSEFAEKLGTTQAAVSKYEVNEREPEIVTLIKIAELGFTTLDWLITGENKPYPIADVSKLASNVSPAKGHWYKIVGKVMAGTAILFEDNIVGEIFLDYHKQNGCFVVEVNGDSMIRPSGGINPGDLVLVDPDQQPMSGDLVVAVVNGRQVIKQLAITREGSELRSWNTEYPPIIISETGEEVELMYRVVLVQHKPIKL